VNVAHAASALEPLPRAVAIGSFDGVHRGHVAVVDALLESGLVPTVLTFDPHPRVALGNRVELLTTQERKLELLAELGVEDTLVVRFDLELSRLEPEEFVARILEPIGCQTVVAGNDFRFGRGRSGDLALLRSLGYDVRHARGVAGASSTAIRDHVRNGQLAEAARLLGRPFELDGTVVSGFQRGGTLGFPTANLALGADLVVPPYGIYAGFARGHRAAVSIGVNPHYGGTERRIEPHLLDFDDDLYGQRLVLELWAYLREERAFASEEELVAQIARDVERTRTVEPPS
jgi:riboflavin kinase / FMN adenylyltransferase